MYPLLTGVLDRLLVDYQLCATAGIRSGPARGAAGTDAPVADVRRHTGEHPVDLVGGP
jgi:hypothetical protein